MDEGTISAGALKGIRVLDLTRVLSGPYCTMMLADQGAEVVKIEIPERGDDARHVGPPFQKGESAFFISINRNKKSVTLDLKSKQGVDLLKRLVRQADVFVENYRPGVAERLGIDYGSLVDLNSRLVYCSISGYGQTGPYRERPGYNFTVQALSGVMTVSGDPGFEPFPIGISLGDIPAGMFAAYAISAALFERERDGRGQYIDISMLDALVAMMEYPLARYGMTGACPPPIGQHNPGITPFGVFHTSDTPIVIAAGNDKLWTQLCDVLSRADLLADPQYKTNPLRTQHRAPLHDALTETLKKRSADDWLELLVGAGIPAARVNDVEDVYHDPQVRSRQMIQSVTQQDAGEVSIVGTPVRMSGHMPRKLKPAPQLGEHVDEILHEWLNLPNEEIATLRADHVI